jgi:hypothetical protein
VLAVVGNVASLSAAEFQVVLHPIELGIIDFVCSSPFRDVLRELSELPEALRHEFVDLVLLDNEQLSLRGVTVPEGLSIQRSYFADNRPTLFCVVAHVPPGFGWKKLTVTYDNQMIGRGIPSFARDENGDVLPFLTS